ncbi:MAG: hypothetical protein ABGW69_00540 [Nanoarchaeota archaeon]
MIYLSEMVKDFFNPPLYKWLFDLLFLVLIYNILLKTFQRPIIALVLSLPLMFFFYTLIDIPLDTRVLTMYSIFTSIQIVRFIYLFLKQVAE